MDKLNVALMVFSNGIGGAEAVVGELARHLDRAAFNCFVITTDEIRAYYERDATTVFSLGKLRDTYHLKRLTTLLNDFWPSRFPRRVFRPAKLREVAAFLERNHIHLLHTHLIADQRFAAALRRAPGLRNLRSVMTVHGVLDLDVGARHPVRPRLLRRMFDTADGVTSACRYFLDRLEACGIRVAHKASLIDNGINEELLASKREPTRDDDILTMTYLGGTRVEKGGDLLVKALDIVVHRRGVSGVHLDILRAVPPDSPLAALIRQCSLEGHVTLAGYVGGGDHLRYISRNDLYVLPSRTEGVANTLMEAIGLGKPVLATAVGGTPEIVTHGQNGYLCEPTPEALAEGILFFVNNPQKLKEYGAANDAMRPRFSWRTVVPHYERLYRALVTRPTPPLT